MSQKDSMSSQDIPVFFRALGTLALAAATAVAIKWFISHDSKDQNPEDNDVDQKKNELSAIQDGQSFYDDQLVLDKVPSGTTNLQQVSDGDEIKLLLEYCQRSGSSNSSPETLSIPQCTFSDQKYVEKTAVNFSGEICPKEGTQFPSVFCKQNNVDLSPAKSALCIQTEDDCKASMVAARAEGSGTNVTEKQISSGSLTHRCDNLSSERSQGIQESEWNFGNSSSDGECFDDLNIKCSRCQYTLTGQDYPKTETCVEHKTVKMGVSEDALSNGLVEQDLVLSCYSEINVVKDTSSSEEKKYNILDLICGNNEDSKLNGRTEVVLECDPFVSKPDMSSNSNVCISNCYSVPMRSNNTTYLEAKSIIESDSLHCAEQLSDVENALSAAHGNTVSSEVCNNITQDTTLYSKQDTQITDIYQSNEIQKLTLYNGDIIRVPKEQLHRINQDSAQVAERHMSDDDDNDSGNMIPSPKKGLSNNYSDNSLPFFTYVDAQTAISHEPQASFQGSSECVTLQESMTDSYHCHLSSQDLPLSQGRRTTTLYNCAEPSDLMSPMELQDPSTSSDTLNMQCKHQFCVEDNSTILNNQGTSEALYENITFERNQKDLEVDGENTGLYCTTNNDPYAMTTLETTMPDSTSLDVTDTVSSPVVTETEFNSSVTPMNYGKGNTGFHNLYTYAADIQVLGTEECCNVITNGYLDINPKLSDDNSGESCSKITEKQKDYYNIDHELRPSKHYSILPNDIFPTQVSSSMNPYSCEDNRGPLSTMMGTHNAQITSDENNDTFTETVTVGREEQLSEVNDLFHSSANPLQQNERNDLTHTDSNLSLTQDQNKCLTVDAFINLCSHNADEVTLSREKIMSTIAENSELILPEYQSKLTPVKKVPLMTRSCDNILSGKAHQGSTLKNRAQSMLCLLTEYYSSKLTSSENEPVEKVARGSFIRIPKGLQHIGEAMSFQLTLGNCLELLKLARKNSVPELLKAVYTVISDNYLNVLKNSAVYGQLTGSERERILQLRMKGKLSLCVLETKSIFGLNKNIRCSAETAEWKTQLYSLDMETNQWKSVTYIPEEACLKGCSICCMHNYLFIAGGLQKTTKGSTCSNKLFCYNPLTDIWTPLSPMNEGRSQLRLIPLDGYLYAIGGECLHTVEKYDPRSNKWTFVAPLPKGSFAVAHEAVACGGEIYISGGHLFFRLLKYSPLRDEWEECPFNASKGRSCDMVAVGNILYRFDMHKDSSVNILKYNTVAKMWSEYTAIFPSSKVPFRCALLGGSVYCLNRETTAKFSMEDEKPVFEGHIFSKVPTRGVGSPHPVVLCLRSSLSQTSV